MTIIPLDDLTNTFLEDNTGLNINDEGIDRNEIYIRWLQKAVSSQDRNLTDLQNSLFAIEDSEQFSEWLSKLGFSGSLDDMKRSFFSGVLSFYAPLTTNLSLITGDDKTYKFDGEDDYIQTSDALGIDGSLDFSVETEIVITNLVDQLTVIDSQDASTVPRTRIVVNAGKIQLLFRPAGLGTTTIETGVLTTGTYKVNIRRDSNRMYLVVDDVAIGDSGIGTGNPTVWNSSDLFTIGREYSGVNYYEGSINYVKISQDATQTNLVASYDLTTSKLGADQVKDLSGNGNHGTSYGKGEFTRTTTKTGIDYLGNVVEVGVDVPVHEGARFINDDKGWSEYIGENAIEFDCVDDLVQIPNFNEIGGSNDELTVMSFCKGDGTEGTIASHYDTDGNQRSWFIEAESNKTIEVVVSNDGSFSAGHYKLYYSSLTILENQYNSVGFTFDKGILKLFINGVEDPNPTKVNDDAITTLHNSTDDILIGARFRVTPENYFGGIIDNTKIWDKALTGEEVMQEYLQSSKDTNITANDNLVGWWKLDDTTSDIIDYSGNGNDGTFYSGGVASTPILVEGVYDSGARISNDTLKGISIEEQRTNLLTYSEELDNATGGWSESNCTVSLNQDTSPRGDLTADRIIPDVGTDFSGVYKYVSGLSDSTDYCFSIYVKKNDYRWIRLETRSKTGLAYDTWFDLDNVVVGTDESAGISLIEEFGDYYRCSVVRNVSTGGSLPRFAIRLADDDNNTDVTGDGSSYNTFWGAQVEEGTFPTSYIPTTSTSVTRTKDNLSYDYNNNIDFTEGTCAAEVTYQVPTITNYFVDTGGGGRLLYTTLSSTDSIKSYDGTTTSSISNSPNFQDNQLPVSSSWGSDGLTVAKNGEENLEVFDGAMETGDIDIGRNAENVNIKNIKIWKEQLSETERKRLTQ